MMFVWPSSTAIFTPVLRLSWAVGACALAFFSNPTYSQTYSAGLNHSRWLTTTTPFSCSLTHKIPGYGVATFSRRAGGAETFELQQHELVLPAGLITIEAIPPSWRSDMFPIDLGQTQAFAGKTPVRLSSTQLPPLMVQLEKGMQVLFSASKVSDAGTSVRVGLEAQQFPVAYKKYQQCLAQLIPYSFQQVSRITINYKSSDESLSTSATAQLDKVVRYAKADGKVLGVMVDAHSEKLIDPANAEAASKLQADLVVAYLIARGLPADKITARWHGDKFPIASNLTATGKAHNRRVTVRLENADTRRETEQKIAARKAAEEKLAANKAAEEKRAQENLAEQTPVLKRLVDLVEDQDLTSGKQPDADRAVASPR